MYSKYHYAFICAISVAGFLPNNLLFLDGQTVIPLPHVTTENTYVYTERIAISYPLLIGESFLSDYPHSIFIEKLLRGTSVSHWRYNDRSDTFFPRGARSTPRLVEFSTRAESSLARCLIIRELIEVETSGEETMAHAE